MHLYERHYELVKNILTAPIIPDELPLLNTSILDETGKWNINYSDVFNPVLNNDSIDKMMFGNNDLLNWCISKIKS